MDPMLYYLRKTNWTKIIKHLKPLQMKTRNLIGAIFIGVMSFLLSCTQKGIHEAVTEEATSVIEAKESGKCDSEAIPNQLVVKFFRHVEEIDKRILRAELEVKNFKKCDCADKTLELWEFDEKDSEGKPLNIEEKKAIAEDNEADIEGADLNFIMTTTGTTGFYNGGNPHYTGLPTSLYTTNADVTIAVLDTGIQYDYFEQSYPPFLYYNGLSNTCSSGMDNEFSGWDFVNNDATPYDDNGHGTIVTTLITKTILNYKNSVPFQILPVKIFDEKGKGTYFDLLCGYRYAVKKPGMDIINMSFGWCGERQTLLEKFIGETERKGKILVVASAGNQKENNDQMAHYPSSYPNKNVLSIGAINQNNTDLASFSNFGKHSVDFAATGDRILFDFGHGVEEVSGTSFATAFATANAAYYYAKGTPRKHIEAKLKGTSKYLNSLKTKTKHSSYLPK